MGKKQLLCLHDEKADAPTHIHIKDTCGANILFQSEDKMNELTKLVFMAAFSRYSSGICIV